MSKTKITYNDTFYWYFINELNRGGIFTSSMGENSKRVLGELIHDRFSDDVEVTSDTATRKYYLENPMLRGIVPAMIFMAYVLSLFVLNGLTVGYLNNYLITLGLTAIFSLTHMLGHYKVVDEVFTNTADNALVPLLSHMATILSAVISCLYSFSNVEGASRLLAVAFGFPVFFIFSLYAVSVSLYMVTLSEERGKSLANNWESIVADLIEKYSAGEEGYQLLGTEVSSRQELDQHLKKHGIYSKSVLNVFEKFLVSLDKASSRKEN